LSKIQRSEARHLDAGPISRARGENMVTESAVELLGISKSFPGVKALKNVSLSVKKGSVHALVGENGAGKSTLLKILSGVYLPDEGIITLEGKEIHPQSPSHAHHLGISLVYQELQQVPELSVAENIFLAREITFPGRMIINRKRCYSESERLLEHIGISIDVRSPIKSLSIAERQMVEISKALLGKARVIAFDEPTSSLSAIETQRLFDVINELKKQNVGIIYVSHRLEEIGHIADWLTILRDGELVVSGPSSEFNRDTIVHYMVGRELESFSKDAVREAQKKYDRLNLGKEVLRISSIYNNKVKNASFSLYYGEILGIAGLVGSGRTELARAIYGVDAAEGEVLINGRKIANRNPKRSIKEGICLIPEDRKGQALLRLMSMSNNIAFSALKKVETACILSRKKMASAAYQFVEKLNIRPDDPDIIVSSLSGGNQQKVILARWLFANSSVLIFDEPTRGIDVGAKSEIYHLMYELASQGKSIIMISSDLPEILLMSDRILVMREGKIVGEVKRENATEQIIMQYATGGR
jgi:ribose transport system ATP-binding protein